MRIAIATSPARPDKPNEDYAAATANGAVLLDGAGLSGTASKCHHGVAWYTRHLGAAILAGLPDTDRDLATVLADAISETAQLHAGTCSLEDPGTPSATVVITRLVADRLHYLVLADSVLVLDEGGGTLTVITDNREATVGAAHRADLDAHPNGTTAHDEALRTYIETVRRHRNRPGGFWVAAADPAAAHQAITGDRRISDLSRALLLSDGASRIVDRFGLVTWQELFGLVQEHGLGEVIRRVRRAEADDPHGARWARGKVHDDATLAYWTDLGEQQVVVGD